MLNSTIEMITLAASNSLLIFCFCNFIIAVLLVGGSKPTSGFCQDSKIHPPTFAFRNGIEVEGAHSTTCSVDNHNASTGVSESCAVEVAVDEEKENDDELRRRVEESCAVGVAVDEEKENEDGDDDELRRRVEEFIDKINKGWKAEKLGPLCQ